MQAQSQQKEFWCYRQSKSLIIEQLSPIDDQLIKSSRARSFNVTFPNNAIVRVNILQMGQNKLETHSELVRCLDDQFGQKLSLNLQKQCKRPTIFYCNQKTRMRTCIRQNILQAFQKDVIKFLAIRKLLSQQKQALSPSSNYDIFQGFDATLIAKYMIYGQKCHLPVQDFLEQAVEKGYVISRFTNSVKFLYQELRDFHLVSGFNRISQLKEKGQEEFWSIGNFQYDIESKSMLISPSAIENLDILKEGSHTPSVLRKSKYDEANESQMQSRHLIGNNIIEIQIIEDKQTQADQNSIQQSRDQTLSYNFYEDELVRCLNFIKQVNQTVFAHILQNNSIKPSSFKFSSGNKNFQNMVLNSEDFKNKLAEKQQINCLTNHLSVTKIPLKVQQCINRAKLYAAAYTQKSYSNFFRHFMQTYPSSPIFNPTAIYFSEITFCKLFLQSDSCGIQKEAGDKERIIFETMKELTEILLNRYENEINFKEHEELIKHQKMILSQVTNNCEADACLEIVEFKLAQLSLSSPINSQKQQKQGNKRQESPRYQSPLVSKTSSQKPQQKGDDSKKNVSKQRQQQYEYENIILWEEISLRKNYSNLSYGRKGNNTGKRQTLVYGSRCAVSSHLIPIGSNKHNICVEDIKLQLNNQIRHYKNEILRIQSQMVEEAQFFAGQQTERIGCEGHHEFLGNTIKSNLLILELTARIHFYNSLLKRLGPLYEFDKTIYHLDKILSIVKIAKNMIDQLNHISNANYHGSNARQARESLFLNELKDFSKTFRQTEIDAKCQKLGVWVNYMKKWDSEAVELCKKLEVKIQSLYGKYHWWNIFVQLNKLKLIENQEASQLNQLYFGDFSNTQRQATEQKMFAHFKQQLLQTYVYIKQIQFTNGQQTMTNFLLSHPRVSKRLIELDRELIKFAHQDFDLNFLLSHKIEPMKSLNALYPEGLYRILFNDKRSNYNNPNTDYYCLAFSNPNSQFIKSLDSLAVLSLYHEQDKFYFQLKQLLQQAIKSLSEISIQSISTLLIQSKFSKCINLIKDHPLLQVVASLSYTRQTIKSMDIKIRDELETKEIIKFSVFQQSLFISYLMIKTIFLTFASKSSQILLPSKLESFKLQIYSHIELITKLLSDYKKYLDPQNYTFLYCLQVISQIHFFRLFHVDELKTYQKASLQKLSKRIQQVQSYILNLPKNAGLRHAFGQDILFGQKLLSQMLRILEDKLLYLGLVLGDGLIVRDYYNKKIGDFTMMSYSNTKYVSQRPMEGLDESLHKQNSQQKTFSPMLAKMKPSDTETSAKTSLLPSQPLKPTDFVQGLNLIIEQIFQSVKKTMNSLPMRFSSSADDLYLLAQINYHQKHFLLSFEYLQITMNLLFKKQLNEGKRLPSKHLHESSLKQSQFGIQMSEQNFYFLVDIVSKMIRILIKWSHSQLKPNKNYFINVGIKKIKLTAKLLSFLQSNHQTKPQIFSIGESPQQNSVSQVNVQENRENQLKLTNFNHLKQSQKYQMELMAFVYSSAVIFTKLMAKNVQGEQKVDPSQQQEPSLTNLLKRILFIEYQSHQFSQSLALLHLVNQCLVQYRDLNQNQSKQKGFQETKTSTISQLSFVIDVLQCIVAGEQSLEILHLNNTEQLFKTDQKQPQINSESSQLNIRSPQIKWLVTWIGNQIVHSFQQANSTQNTKQQSPQLYDFDSQTFNTNQSSQATQNSLSFYLAIAKMLLHLNQEPKIQQTKFIRKIRVSIEKTYKKQIEEEQNICNLVSIGRQLALYLQVSHKLLRLGSQSNTQEDTIFKILKVLQCEVRKFKKLNEKDDSQVIELLLSWCHYKLLKQIYENKSDSVFIQGNSSSYHTQIVTEVIKSINTRIMKNRKGIDQVKNQKQKFSSKKLIELILPDTIVTQTVLQLISYLKANYQSQNRVPIQLLNLLNLLKPLICSINQDILAINDPKCQTNKLQMIYGLIYETLNYLQVWVNENSFGGNSSLEDQQFIGLIQNLIDRGDDNLVKSLIFIELFRHQLCQLKHQIKNILTLPQFHNSLQTFRKCKPDYRQENECAGRLIELSQVLLTANCIKSHQFLSKIIKTSIKGFQNVHHQNFTARNTYLDLNQLAELISSKMPSFTNYIPIIDLNHHNQSRESSQQGKMLSRQTSLQLLVHKYFNHMSRMVGLLHLQSFHGLVVLQISFLSSNRPKNSNSAHEYNPIDDKSFKFNINVNAKCNESVQERIYSGEQLSSLTLDDIEAIESQKQLISDLLELIQNQHNQLSIKTLNKTNSNLKDVKHAFYSQTTKSPNASTQESVNYSEESAFVKILYSIYNLFNQNF